MGARGLSGAITLALHVVVLAALINYAPARSAMLAAAPIMVSLITAQRAEPTPAPVEMPLPKSKPVAKPKPEPAMVAAPAPAPAQMNAPAPEPVNSVPAPAPAPLAAAPLEVVTPPVFNADYLDNPSPPYPMASRRTGQQGRVVLRVLVGAAGTAEEVQIRDSSGHQRLDESARDTVRRWRFAPAKRGVQPVPAWVLIPISFRLEG